MSSQPGLRIDRDNPWPGLFPYSEDASAFFNGREQETAELLRLVKRDVLCLLYGQSGLGKSSLIQAGLFPRLREEAFFPVYVRLDFGSPLPVREQLWRVFGAALDRQRIDARRPAPSEGLWAYFNDAALEFWDERNRALAPVVVLDQLEEIFTSGSALAQHLASGGFLAELAELIDGRVPERVRAELESDFSATTRYHFGAARFRVLLGFREDFLPEFEELFRALRLPTGGRLRLTRMREEQALDAVRRTGGDLVDAEVGAQIVDFVSGRSRAGKTAEIEPALLSVVCYELNNRRRQRGEARISSALLSGAREQIIEEFYHRSVAGVAPEVREFIEEELLTESGYRDSAAIEDAVKRPGVSEAAIRELVEKRVLRLEERFGVLRVELTHDLLTSVVLKDRNERQERVRLEAEREREAARLRRTRRLLRLGMATAAGAAILVIVFAVLLQRAEEEKAKVIQTQSSLLLARATSALEQNVPKEPYVSLARALALDPENAGAAARSVSLITQRNYPALELALPWDGVSPRAFVGPIDERTLLLLTDETYVTLKLPAIGRPGAFSVACVRSTLERSDAPVQAELKPPSSPEAWTEVRKAARAACGPKAGGDAFARLLGVDTAAAAYATRGGDLIIAGHDGSRRSSALGVDVAPLRRAWTDPRHERALVAGAGAAYLVATGSPAAFAPAALPADDGQGEAEVVRAAFAADGSALLVARRGGQGELWSLAPLHRLARFRLEFPEAAALSPDGRWLAAMRGSVVEFYDTRDGQVKGTMQSKLPFNHVEFAADGSQAVLSSQSGNVYVTGVPEARGSRTLAHEGAAVEAHFLGPQLVVTAAFDGAVRIFSTTEESGALLSEPMLHRGPVIFARPAGASPAGVRIVSLADDQVLRVWRARLDAPPALRPPLRSATAIDFSRDGSTFARLDRQGEVQVGAVDPKMSGAAPEAVRTFRIAESAPVRRVRLDADGGTLAWARDDGVVSWRRTRGGEVFALPQVALPSPAADIEIAGKAGLLAVRLQDQGIRVVDLASARPTGLAIEAGDGAIAWGFARDGERILVALPQKLQAFDARTGFALASRPTSGIVSADVNPRAPEIAHSRGREVAIWDAESAAAPRARTMPTFVSAVRFAADGTKLATLSIDGNVRILEAATLAEVGSPLRHSFSVSRAEFSPDGRWVVTTALDGVVRIWDYTTGQVIASASQRGAAGQGRALLLGRNNWLALVGGDGAVEWVPVAIGFPAPLPDWFGSVFASLSGLAAIDEPAPAVARSGAARADAEWEAWWKAWRSYVAERKSSWGG